MKICILSSGVVYFSDTLPRKSLIPNLSGKPLGKYHKIETIKGLNIYIYFGLSGHHQELHETWPDWPLLVY